MTKRRRSEGPRAPLFYSALLAAAISPPAASAETVDLAELEACAALSGDEQKLACFNAVIAAANAGQAIAPEPAAERQQAGATGAAAGAKSIEAVSAIEQVAVDTAPSSAGPDTVTPTAAMDSRATQARAAVPASPPPSEPAPAAAVTAGPDPDFGREQLEQDDQRIPDRVQATVVDVTRAYNDALLFHLANGQVWRQIEPRRYPYPKNAEFGVTISQGVMGEYRLRIGNNGRMVRIRRIK